MDNINCDLVKLNSESIRFIKLPSRWDIPDLANYKKSTQINIGQILDDNTLMSQGSNGLHRCFHLFPG